jgi:tRNA modification GTPase
LSEDTIAAIATPPGSGGVGIVRLSGPRAVALAAALVGSPEERLVDRRIQHGHARGPDTGERLDEVLVLVMRGPRSYTGEDVAEVHGHGGVLNMARLLGACVALGARVAEPGEFTRRAYRNGRLDLLGAEAVCQVIAASSERALATSQAQLGGALGQTIARLRREAVALLADVEGGIDFPEEGLDETPPAVVAARAQALATETWRLARSYSVGRALQEGVHVALVGAPNVGKSSLFNALVGQERAVVSAEPGTTRDYVEARVVWDGIPVTLIDTAGERDAAGAERRGVELGQARAARADLVVRVMDAEGSGPEPAAEGELRVWNKADLCEVPAPRVGISALTGRGLEGLKGMVLRALLGDLEGVVEGEVISTERQRALLEEASRAAGAAAAAALEERPSELWAADLRVAAARLAALSGEGVGEDVLDALFARFCIGK